MVGAKGFEPSTSWSRNSISKILNALSGVAYETKEATFPLSVVPKLYPRRNSESQICGRIGTDAMSRGKSLSEPNSCLLISNPVNTLIS
jgi:hypothetical protein